MINKFSTDPLRQKLKLNFVILLNKQKLREFIANTPDPQEM